MLAFKRKKNLACTEHIVYSILETFEIYYYILYKQ